MTPEDRTAGEKHLLAVPVPVPGIIQPPGRSRDGHPEDRTAGSAAPGARGAEPVPGAPVSPQRERLGGHRGMDGKGGDEEGRAKWRKAEAAKGRAQRNGRGKHRGKPAALKDITGYRRTPG